MSERPTRAAWLGRAVAAALVAAPAIELAGRSIGRASLAERLTGGEPAGLVLALLAVIGTSLGVGLARRGGRVEAHTLVRWLLLFALTPGLACQLRLGARLQSDGFYYFAHLRSLWFDRDLDLANDYRLLGLGSKAYLFVPTPTGHAQSAWTIGPSLAWAPFFAAGDVVARRLAAGGRDVAVDGTSFPYRQSVCVAGLVWGLIGLYATFRLGVLLVPAGWSAAGTLLVGGGSFLLWYLVKEPSMTHAPSMAAVAIFAWAWYASSGRRRTWQWIALGVIAGLAGTIRWQNVVFALLPACEWLVTAVAVARSGDRARLARHAGDGVAFTAGAVAGFAPQMLAWKAIYGSYLSVSPIGPEVRWWAPRVGDILWSSRHGLFSTSPVVYLGIVGLGLLAWRTPAFGVPALLVFAAMTWFNASLQDWWGSASFGMRRFDGVLPLVAAGAAALLHDVSALVARRPQATVAAAAIGGLTLWNLTFMEAALAGVVPMDDPVAFEHVAARQGATLERWFGHPFSYPANLVFALRNGRSPAEYDLLWVGRFLADPTKPYGRLDIGGADAPWMEEGWYEPEAHRDTTFRWAQGRAVISLPLDHAAALRVVVRAMPFAWPGAPPQSLTLEVNGTIRASTTLGDGWQDAPMEVAANAWRSGVNQVALVFARAARPMDVGVSQDRRTLAAAVDWIRVATLDRSESR